MMRLFQYTRIKCYFTIFLLLVNLISFAQQDPSYSQFLQNRLLINPAFAGTKKYISSSFTYRDQWIKQPGTLRTMAFSIHAPIIHNSAGIGLYVINDQFEDFRNLTLMSNYSYKINLADGIFSMGLSGGLRQISANYILDPKDRVDQALPINEKSSLVPDFGTGAQYSSEKVTLGFAVSHLTEPNFTISSSLNSDARYFRHYYLYGSYVLKTSEYLSVQPAFLLKKVAGVRTQADIGYYLKYLDVGWTGVFYRSNNLLSFQFGLNMDEILPQFHERLSLGYSIDWPLVAIAGYKTSSHELVLLYNFQINSGVKKIKRKTKSISPKLF